MQCAAPTVDSPLRVQRQEPRAFNGSGFIVFGAPRFDSRITAFPMRFGACDSGNLARRLLQGDPELANSPEVPAIDLVQSQVRPRLDAVGWEAMLPGADASPPRFEVRGDRHRPYEQCSAKRARYWAVFALMRWGNALLDNIVSGEDVQIAQELFEATQLLLAEFPPDRLLCDSWNLAARICHFYGESHYSDGIDWLQQAIQVEESLGLTREAARDHSSLGAFYVESAELQKSRGEADNAKNTLGDAEKQLVAARDVLRSLKDYEALSDNLVNLAVSYERLDKWEQAQASFKEAWDCAQLTSTQRPVRRRTSLQILGACFINTTPLAKQKSGCARD
jgi:tetratricopeptide (TPR) repeat protein